MKNRKVKSVYYIHGFKLKRASSKRPGVPSFVLFLMLSGFMFYGVRAGLMPSPTALLHKGTQKIAASVLKENPADGDKSVLSSNTGGKKPQKIKVKNKELNQQLAIKARQYNNVKWSVYVEDVNSGLTASYNEDADYKFGSISRLAVLPALETKVNPDRWNNYYFGSPIKDCVNKGLGQSNDACYDKLTKYLGADYINKTIKSYGYDIEFDGSFNATTSSEKMGTYIADLKRGQSLFAKTRRALFDSLYAPKQTAGLSLGCGDCRVANKQSNDKNTAIDAGVVTHGARSYVVVVVAEGGTFDQITDMAQTIDRYMQP